MNSIKRLAGRSCSALSAVAFTLGLLAPVLLPELVYASGQFSPRKITLSSSANGAVSTDANGTAVAPGAGGNGARANHTFNFTFNTSGATIGSVLLEYCTTPLLGTSCVIPTGMDAGTVATIASQSGFAATAPTLDTTTTASATGIFATQACSGTGTLRANCILLKRATPTAETGTPAISLVFGQGAGTDHIKNPTSNGTFYVRITAFSDVAYTTIVDEAAVAASINPTIDITAKVQEKLNFSVSGIYSAPTAACTALAGSGAVALGDLNGVLDTATAYDVHSYFRLNTNANGGTNVLYSGDTLKNAAGTNAITSVGTTATASTPGTSQFGLALDTGNANYSFTNLTPTAPYAGGSGSINTTFTALFAHSTASVTTPVQLAGLGAGTVSCDTGDVRYLGNIATTTKAGIYRTSIAYIAVPTF